MLDSMLADTVVVVHALFILFVVFGGVLVLRWKRLAWFHLPAAAWGAAIELNGWVCPLTYLENYLRCLGGEAGYENTFIEHYLEPLIYPAGLTPYTQIILGVSILLINISIYALVWRRHRRQESGSGLNA